NGGGGGSKKSGSTTTSIDWASYNPQLWPYASTAAVDWFYGVTARPTIAIVDSGIEPGRMDFGARLLGQVDLASLTPNSPGDGTASGVPFAPGNDPFVITVGAADIGTRMDTSDDIVAPWSAYGYTGDGFWKPELGAPGRYMIGPVPQGSVLTQQKPGNITAPGVM